MSHIAYILQTLSDLTSNYKIAYEHETENKYHGFLDFDTRNLWNFGYPLIAIISLMTFVRNIAQFSFVFLFANILIAPAGAATHEYWRFSCQPEG